MAPYQIVRFYFKGGHRILEHGLTLAEAQAHCKDPNTSSTTATSSQAKAVTKRMGPWFDGYQEAR